MARPPATPEPVYLLCATPRCGATLLGQALAATGVSGTRVLCADQVEAAESAFERPLPYIWVSRRDRTRQAVSLWKAQQEGRSPLLHPHYSFAAIDRLRREVTDADRAWMTFFDRHGLEPLALTYEQVAADLPGAVRSVLDHIGVDSAAADGVKPPLERQADDRSERWVEQYERESSEVTV